MSNLSQTQRRDVLSILMATALADGHLHSKEREVLVARLAKFFPQEGDSEISMTAIDTFGPLDCDLATVSQSLRSLDRQAKRMVLELVADVSVADGVVDIRENAFLLEVSEAIGADRELLKELAGERLVKHRAPGVD